MDENSGKDGLVNRVKESFQSGTRPGFLGGEGGGEAPSGSRAEKKASERAAASGAAADSLKGAEDSAGGGLYHGGNNLDEVREEENKAGLYSGEGINNRAGRVVGAAKEAKKGNFKGAFKKGGPILGIFFVIFAVGGIMAGTQVFQPFSLIAQFQESFNSMHVSANARSNRLIHRQLDAGRVKDPVKGTIFGSTFKITKKQQEELAKQGIKYDENAKVLKYKNASGEDVEVSAKNFDDAYRTDPDFFRRYNTGSMTWRGQFASWFGSLTNSFLKNNKLTRNLFKDYKQKVNESEDGDGLKVYKELLEERTSTIRDEDGSMKRSDLNEEKVRQKLEKIRSKVGGATNLGCAVVDTIGMVSALVYGVEALQIINLTASVFESVDKTKSGYGDEAPINEIAGALNARQTSNNAVLSAGTGGNSNNLALNTDYVTRDRSAMESAGISGLYGNGYVNPNDASVQSFNFTNSMKSVLGGIGTTMDTFKGCAYARLVEAGIGTGLDLLAITACLVTIPFGGEGCVGLLADLLVGLVISASVGLVISALISAIVPAVSNMLTRDLVSNLGGEDLGNALTSGANMYQGSVHRINGGSLATSSEYTDFAVAQQQVIAENAKYERMELDPFDATSNYTFIGLIMNQLMSFNTSSSIMSVITSASSVMSSSIAATTPSTSAIALNIAESLPSKEEYEQNCPYLASIGAVGDSYCNPYTITDTSTLDMDPVDVIDSLVNSGNLALVTEDGNTVAKKDVEAIKLAVADVSYDGVAKLAATTSDGEKVVNVKVEKNSDLAKYGKYCGTRNSMFGTVDQTIRNELKEGTSVDTGDSLADGAANGAIGAIPIIGGIIDILDAGIDLSYGGYISGESCVAGNSLSGGSTPTWDRAKIYQRFIEDQSWAESVGLIEKSAMAEYLEEYYKENPLDNSYEGQLARYSGLDKETVSDLLDVIAYYNYIDAYDASERYAFGAPVVDEGEEDLNLENEYVMGGAVVALEGVVYTDVRNRTFAV